MKSRNIVLFALPVVMVFSCLSARAQEERPFKTTLEITIDNVGSAICEVTNKYTASYWDYWTKAVGSNTSIINNQLKKVFPKYHLTDFQHSQDANARSNTVKFKVDGMMAINKNGKWEADLERKDPNITKISDREWLLVEEGETLKIHLPPGTSDAKVEKNSFGKAILTFSPKTGSKMGGILMFAGIAITLGGVALLVRNLMASKKAGPSDTRLVPKVQETTPNPTLNEISKN